MNMVLKNNLAGKLLRLLVVWLSVLLVSACGGGGGGSFPGAAAAIPLFTTAPSDLLIAPGTTATFDIIGGVGAYTVTPTAGPVAAAVNGNKLSITGGAGGASMVVISDVAGTKVAINVTVGTGLDLFTTAGQSVTVAVGASTQFTIGGGSAVYAISSSNIGVATVGINGNRFIINGVAGGKATVTVRDSVGNKVSIDVVVGSPNALFTSASADITLGINATQTFSIGGGIAPYVVSSSNVANAVATASGTAFTLRGVATGVATVIVSDAAGASVKITVTVPAASGAPSLLAVYPNVSTGSVGDILTFTLAGGTPNYAVTINNASVASISPTTVTSGAGTFTATLRNVGSTTIAIIDAVGQTQSVTLTVNPTSALLRLSPSALQIGEDNDSVITLNVFGGTAPYRAFTSDLSIAPVTGVGVVGTTLTIDAASRCFTADGLGTPTRPAPGSPYAITITVVDSLGASATSALTIRDNSKGGTGCR